MTESGRYQPFSTGSQYMDWTERNCVRCIKGYNEQRREWACDIERAINEASIDDGSVSLDIAKRMGYGRARKPDGTWEFQYTWDCGERVS